MAGVERCAFDGLLRAYRTEAAAPARRAGRATLDSIVNYQEGVNSKSGEVAVDRGRS